MRDSLEHLLIPYRLRVVRIGLLATWLTIAALIAFDLLAENEAIERGPFFLLVGAAAIGAGIVSLLPWERLFQTGAGEWILYAWSALDIVLITLLIAYSGGADSEIFVVYFLTTVFFAASYPERGQIGLSLFTIACYLGVLVATGWEVSWAEVIVRLGILGVMGMIASFMSRELIVQMAAREEARAESERRAEAPTTSCVRGVHGDASARAASGLPRSGSHLRRSRGLVVTQGETITVNDYRSSARPMPVLESAGITAALSTPVWVGAEIKAVLSAGMKGGGALTDEEVEAVELLAGMASRALENAELFEEEHRTVERLSEVDRLKDEFLSMVSHDLRTPLTVIEGSAATLDMNWDRIDDAMRTKLLGVIGSNAHKLGDIITKLLDLTRMEAGHFEIREEPIEMGHFLMDVAGRLGSLLADRDFNVDVAQPLVLEGDPTLIGRVVENLLSNAAKYTESGTKVELLAAEKDGRCVITVRDEGPGIPAEDLEHLGERFFRGRAAQSIVRGTRLGLAWVMQILRLHGSELRVTSAPGEGSTFEFSLPLVHTVAETPL